MRRKLKNFKNKNGHSENGASKTLLELCIYREFRNAVQVPTANSFPQPPTTGQRFDSEYSGWSNRSRPRDQSLSLRGPAPYEH